MSMASLRDVSTVRRSPALRRLHRWYRWSTQGQQEVRAAADRLRLGQDETSTTLAHALEAAASNDVSREERAWINDIERLRGRLALSDEEITFTDFGVGLPGEDTAVPPDGAEGRQRTRTVRDLCMTSSNSKYTDRMMLKLVRALRPTSCIEMGTCLGLSGAYQAAALELNGHGRMVTLDGAAALASRAADHFRELGLHRIETRVGPFEDTLADVMREQQPVDFAFVDGHHDGDAIVHYFEAMLPQLAREAVLVFDDVDASPDMERGWATIKEHPAVRAAVDIGVTGLCRVSGTA